jgi:hypothetical protein
MASVVSPPGLRSDKVKTILWTRYEWKYEWIGFFSHADLPPLLYLTVPLLIHWSFSEPTAQVESIILLIPSSLC